MEEMNFEEMRKQYTILKDQLNKQEIVSDRLIRETMKMRNRDISSTKRMAYGCAVFCLIFYPLNCITHAWSTAFTVFTCLMVLFCAVATWYIHKPVEELDFMRDDFATVARVMAKFKKQYDDWLHYATPILVIPFLIWACYEFAWKNAPEGINPWLLTIPIFVGATVGGLVGYHFHHKAVNAAKDILDEINS